MRLAFSFLALLALPACLSAAGGLCFDDYFEDAALRVDFFQTGHDTREFVALDQLYRLETWPGNTEKLIDELNAGPYCVRIYDLASNTLIFSRGHSCIFSEYKTTGPARAGTMKTFHATALVPFPRRSILFVLECRNRQNLLAPIFSTEIDPADIDIVKEAPNPNDRIHTIAQSGPPRDCLDVVFVAEGYMAEQYEEFTADADRYAGVLLNAEPFNSRRARINITAVFRPSAESGVDEPDKGLFRNTVVSSAYNALGLDRYLLIDDTRTLHDIAGRVPHDTIIVLANSRRYGGGGIYNDYCIVTADNSTSERIFLHEFGHSFANLADEYFSAAVAYDEFFPKGVEPLEANITALLDPQNVKWKDLLTPSVPVPTPWGQEEIEELRAKKEKLTGDVDRRITRLQARKKANKEKEQALRAKLAEKARQIDDEIDEVRRKYKEQHKDTVGVFEGAGYTAKGLYRSGIETDFLRGNQYSPVARRTVERVLDHHVSVPCCTHDASQP